MNHMSHSGAGFPRVVILLVAGAVSMAASASDMTTYSLEQLMQVQVTTASRYAQTTLEAPASVSVVTAEDIRTFGYRSLADVLGSLRGLYISNDRSYQYLGTRGFATAGDYNTRVLLLVNGVRFNDNLYDQANIGTDFPIDLDLIDRVEFVSGPGSAVYGANAFFGVVNIITRDGRQMKGPQVSVEGGSLGRGKLRFSYGASTDSGGDWLISATRFNAQGADLYFPAFDAPATHNGVAHALDYDRGTQLYGRLHQGEWTFSLAHGERIKGVPTAAYSQVFNDARSRYSDESTRVAAEYTTRLQPTTTFTGRLYAGRYAYAGDYVYDYPPVTINHDATSGQWVGAEWQWVSTAVERHKLSWGVDTRRDVNIRLRNYDVDPYTLYLNARRTGSLLGLYLQDEFALAPQLTLHAGLRWDKQSGTAGAINPRLGLVYWLQPHTALKVLYGTAYRPANAYERDYRVDSPGGLIDNGVIRSERVRTSEIALEHALTASSRVVVTAFRSQVRDLIALADAPVPDRLVFGNTPGVRVHGVEAELDQRSPEGARLRLAYGWQQARDVATHQALINSPQHLLKAQWSDHVPLAGAASGGGGRYAVELIGMSSRVTLAGRRLPSAVVGNLAYTTRVGPTTLLLGVYNVLNRRYADPASYEIREDALVQDGRSYRIKLTYEF